MNVLTSGLTASVIRELSGISKRCRAVFDRHSLGQGWLFIGHSVSHVTETACTGYTS